MADQKVENGLLRNTFCLGDLDTTGQKLKKQRCICQKTQLLQLCLYNSEWIATKCRQWQPAVAKYCTAVSYKGTGSSDS